ncbi:MAG: hypothetical protein V1888_02735 [archaeon]
MVRAIMIVEMAGRPAEHLTEALEKHVGILHKVNDITVHEIKVSEPREIELKKGEKINEDEKMFTAFAECDFESPSFARLSETMFDFMPSSVEVIEPSSIKLEMSEATDLLNNISGRMHRYDEIAKIAGERLRQAAIGFDTMKKVLTERDGIIARLSSDRKISLEKKKVKKK